MNSNKIIWGINWKKKVIPKGKRIGRWKSQKLGPFWVIYLQDGKASLVGAGEEVCTVWCTNG
jgi:hypothetical protein